jgi:hypothetical protein
MLSLSATSSSWPGCPPSLPVVVGEMGGCRHFLVPPPSLHSLRRGLTYNENHDDDVRSPRAQLLLNSLFFLQLSFTLIAQLATLRTSNPTIPFTTMSFARTSTQALRLRAAPAVRSNLRTRGTGYRFNSSNAGPNAQANMHPAVAGAAAGAGAAVLIGYGAYKYTVSLDLLAAMVLTGR